MNKKLLKVFASLSLLALVTVGCDGNSDNSSSSDNSAPTVTDSTSIDSSTTADESSSETIETPSGSISSESVSSDETPSVPSDSSTEDPTISDSSTSEPEPAPETNVVVVATSGEATVSLSATEATAGEFVTITITPNAGYRVDKVLLNGQELDTNIKNEYTFKMPNDSAIINVYTALENKDGYIVDGDIQAQLVDEDGDGVYVAKNIVVEADSTIWYSLGADSDPLGMVEIDNAKTFANIGLSGGKDGFVIGGNSIYDFYYDSNNPATPIYIQRVGIINLPATEESFAALFAGTAKSASTLYPANVNKVTYTSASKSENYVWELYSDNSSYATVTNPMTGMEKAIVYKAQNGNVYTVVDSYAEGVTESNYATSSDKTVYSGKYDIVSTTTSGQYQYLQSEVDFDANLYSHNMYALDAELYKAYRNGYVGNIYNDVTVEHDAEVISTRLPSGGFSIALDSWVRWEGSAVYAESEGYRNAYITYDIDAEFTEGGAVKELTYKETIYGDAYYDFSTNTFKTGFATVEPRKYITVKYEYGAAKAGQPNVDVSQYFTQSITDVTINSKKCEVENTLAIGEELVANVPANETSKTNMLFTCLPATALDTWQYGTVSSSNHKVLGPRYTTTPYEFIAYSAGSSDITIGNHTKNANDVTYTHTVNVDSSAYVKGVWMYPGSYLNGADYDSFGANSGYVQAGTVVEVQVAGTTTSGSYAMNSLGLTFEVTSGPADLLDLYYDNSTGRLTIDATNATVSENTTVNVKVVCPVKVEDWPESSFTFYVTPASDDLYPDSIVGIWSTESEECAGTIIEFISETEGVINYVGSLGNREFDFTYTYDDTKGNISVSIGSEQSTYYTALMYIDPADGALCVALSSEKIGSSWDDVTYADYIGMVVNDDTDSYFSPFFKE